MFEFLEDLYNGTVPLVSNVSLNKGDRTHRVLISLYATIIEQVDSAMTLHRAGKVAGIDIIQRSSLEAYVDLINLASDPDYINQMLVSYHSEWIKLAREGVRGNNQFLAAFAANNEAAALLTRHEAELAGILASGPALNLLQRFQKAGMEDVYRSIYNSLCTESHNNIRALTSRHFLPDGDDIHMVIFQQAGDDLQATWDSFTSILAGSNFIIHEYFRSPAMATILEYDTKWNERIAATLEAERFTASGE